MKTTNINHRDTETQRTISAELLCVPHVYKKKSIVLDPQSTVVSANYKVLRIAVNCKLSAVTLFLHSLCGEKKYCA